MDKGKTLMDHRRQPHASRPRPKEEVAFVQDWMILLGSISNGLAREPSRIRGARAPCVSSYP
jgi:hypothetical protein